MYACLYTLHESDDRRSPLPHEGCAPSHRPRRSCHGPLSRKSQRPTLLPIPPPEGTSDQRKPKTSDQPLFGLWQDRDDLKDPASYLRKLRQPRAHPWAEAARSGGGSPENRNDLRYRRSTLGPRGNLRAARTIEPTTIVRSPSSPLWNFIQGARSKLEARQIRQSLRQLQFRILPLYESDRRRRGRDHRTTRARPWYPSGRRPDCRYCHRNRSCPLHGECQTLPAHPLPFARGFSSLAGSEDLADHFPTKCRASFSFSTQKNCSRSVSTASVWFTRMVQGLVYALESSTVTSISNFPNVGVKSLRHLACVSQRRTTDIEPKIILETIRLDHQRVSFPLPSRISVKGGLRSTGRGRPSVKICRYTVSRS